MPDLKNLIRQYPELGEVLAEFENRISYLMNSQTTSQEPGEDKPQVIEHIHRHSDMGKKEFDLLQRMAKKVKELSGKQANKYTIGS